jgi:hypothetical protein
MIVDPFQRPATGPESVPMPPVSCSRQDWLEYLLKVRRAEMDETAGQATERCRAEAARVEEQLLFNATLETLLEVYDSTVPDPECAGLGLDQAGYFDEYLLADLAKHWREMQIAFADADRPAFHKAAAKFTGKAAGFAAGLG